MSRSTIIMFAIILLGLTPLLMADIGPKPTADFEIEYQIEPVPDLLSYALYLCRDAGCTDAYMLEEAGPQHFSCDQDTCTSMAYGYTDEMYIVLEFDDGVSRASNIFTKDHFNAEYRITVNHTDLMVEETGGNNSGSLGPIGGGILIFTILAGCGVVVFIGLIVLAVVLIMRNSRRRKPAADPDKASTAAES